MRAFIILFIGMMAGTVITMVAACLAAEKGESDARDDLRRLQDESDVDDSAGTAEDSEQDL